MAMRQATKEAGFDARGFIRDNLLPTAIETQPKDWPRQLRANTKRLPHEQRTAVIREAKAMLKPRKRMIAAAIEAIQEVKALVAPDGEPVGKRLRGIVLFGGMTGKSHGLISLERAVDLNASNDVDYFIVMQGCRMGDEIAKCVMPAMGEKMRQKMAAAISKPANAWMPLTVHPEDPFVTVIGILTIKSTLPHMKPESWRFIGDDETRTHLTDALELIKE
jgi:hypothetical protein